MAGASAGAGGGSSRFDGVLLTLVVLATACIPEGLKAVFPRGIKDEAVSQGVPFAHAASGCQQAK